MADSHEELKARYTGLMGLARLLMSKLYGDESGVKPGPPPTAAAPPTGPQRVFAQGSGGAGDLVGSHYDTGNNDAVAREIDPNYLAKRIRANAAGR